MLPAPTSAEIQEAWRAVNPAWRGELRTQLVLVPHAAVPESHTTAVEAMQHLPDALQEVWILPTKHSANQNEEHSVYINEALLTPKKSRTCTTRIWWKERPTFAEAATFLQANARHAIICSSDLSHENGVAQQDILAQEAQLISSLMQNAKTLDGLDKVTACGPDVVQWFHGCAQHLQQKIVVTAYNDSSNRAHFWTNVAQARLVSYVSALACPQHDVVPYANLYTIFACLYKSYALSKLFDDTITLPAVYAFPNIENGLFITVKEGSATRACIGRFFTPRQRQSLLANLEDILPDLHTNARDHWGQALAADKIESYTIELTILASETTPIDTAQFVQQKSATPAMRQLAYRFMCKGDGVGGGSGTFIPAVWLERPTWSPAQYLEEIHGKAGCDQGELVSMAALVV